MAARNFSRCLTTTLLHEGGFVNDPADPGGATNMGITRNTLAGWRDAAVSVDDVRRLTRAEAGAIYRRRYWELVGCDRLPEGVDLAVFDYAVNSGVERASQALQAALGVTEDGIVGPDTLRAAQEQEPRAVILALCAGRRGFLRRLRIFTRFGRGWLRRVAAVEAVALTMTRPRPPVSRLLQLENETMNHSKSIVESRTIWANVVGLAALAASVFGFNTHGLDQPAVVEAILNGVAGVSFVASTIFRVKATKALG